MALTFEIEGLLMLMRERGGDCLLKHGCLPVISVSRLKKT